MVTDLLNKVTGKQHLD